MKSILAIDPGTTTGFAFYNQKDWTFEQCPYDLEMFWSTLEHFVKVSGDDNFVIVSEIFEFRKDKDRDKIVFDSAKLNGIVEWFCCLHKVPMFYQNASYAKSGFWADDMKLRTLGLWRSGNRHAMDALRHSLMWQTFNTENVERSTYWFERLPR